MITILKNALVTGVSQQEVSIRKKELDWFTNNYWIIATQATVTAGFSFKQLTRAIPRDVPLWATYFYVSLTSLSLALSLYVIVKSTFACMLAPGMALRGPLGFGSMKTAIEILRKNQDKILWCYMLALSCFVFSSFMVVYIFGRRKEVALRAETLLLFVVLLIIFFSWRITLRFHHDRTAESSINAIENPYMAVGDLDAISHQFQRF